MRSNEKEDGVLPTPSNPAGPGENISANWLKYFLLYVIKAGFEQGKGSGKHYVFPLGVIYLFFDIFKKRRPEGGSPMGTVEFLPGLPKKKMFHKLGHFFFCR